MRGAGAGRVAPGTGRRASRRESRVPSAVPTALAAAVVGFATAATLDERRSAPRAAAANGSVLGSLFPGGIRTLDRIFNDLAQNLFSENGVTQWAFTWGLFLDHTFGLREIDGEDAPIPFDPDDPLESFEAHVPAIDFRRTPAAPGTGEDSPREQMNTGLARADLQPDVFRVAEP